MPIFHDLHPPGQLSTVVLSEMLARSESRQPGPAGVRVIDYVIGEGGTITCVLDAPNEVAVYRYHTALGLPCGRVRPRLRLLPKRGP